MKKDVIYIDIDDDVTAIIGKVKAAKEKLVVLVPPKRVGALQSAVNLRLLQRMVKSEGKHLVLVTSNPALVGLAAASKIPVAKNLQSKPEVPEIPALIVDDGDDIIDGAALPVEDHVKSSGSEIQEAPKSRSKAIEDVDISLNGIKPGSDELDSPVKKAVVAKSVVKSKQIPDFDKFRNRLFIGIGAGLGLAALLVWMFVFAPAATVTITARTSPEAVNTTARLGGTAATSFEKGIISSIFKKEKRDITVDFEATGSKNVGEKATGVITLTNCDSMSVSFLAGTKFATSAGLVYMADSAVTVPEVNGSATQCRVSGGNNGGTATVNVTAETSGVKYNIAAARYEIRNFSGDVFARGSAMAGGTDRVAKVVTQEDIERATGQLVGSSTDEYKSELIASFTNGEKAIDSSFNLERGETNSVPAVGEEAPEGKAKLVASSEISIHAVRKGDLETFLKQYLDSKKEETQKVFSTGIDKATVGNFQQQENSEPLVSINAAGTLGPNIDELEIKELAKGRIYGDVQSTLTALPGVQEVDVKFSYFWVRTVPGDVNKITVDFKVEDEQ